MTAPPATDLSSQVMIDFSALSMEKLRSLAGGILKPFTHDVIAKVRSGQCVESIQGQRD